MKLSITFLVVFIMPIYSFASDSLSGVRHNATFERIICTACNGKDSSETLVSCRMVFKGLPSSYTYYSFAGSLK